MAILHLQTRAEDNRCRPAQGRTLSGDWRNLHISVQKVHPFLQGITTARGKEDLQESPSEEQNVHPLLPNIGDQALHMQNSDRESNFLHAPRSSFDASPQTYAVNCGAASAGAALAIATVARPAYDIAAGRASGFPCNVKASLLLCTYRTLERESRRMLTMVSRNPLA